MRITQQEASGSQPQQRRKWGAATVELAIVAPVLIVLMFGIIEMGLLMNHVLGLKQAAREGVRVAATGVITTEIIDCIHNSSGTLDNDALQIQLEYRPYGAPDHEDFWETLGDTGGGDDAQNYAPHGSYVRAALTYPHQLVTGGLFSRLADEEGGQTVTLRTKVVMRRE